VSAQIYWYPETDGPLRVVDLGRGWRDLIEGDPADVVSARNADGQRVLTTYMSMRVVRAACEYIDDREALTECQAIGNHLRRNGVIGIAEDAGHTWGGFANVLPVQGATEVTITENLWADWGTGGPNPGDTIVVQGPSPSGRWEECVVLSTANNRRKITLASGLRYDYSDGAFALVRDARFWPILRLQDAALNLPILKSDRRITWSLDLQLEEPPHRLTTTAETAEPFRGPDPASPLRAGYDAEIPADATRGSYTGGLAYTLGGL
jgi:hypothetical protein